jgi:phosphoribosylglycinamide formyltransferase-1
MARLRVAVLLSGSGTTLENLFVKREAGELDADIVAVVSSRADAYGLERAKKRGVPSLLIEKKKFKTADEFSKAIFSALEPYNAELIVLAGFMSLLKIPSSFKNRVVNVHPALLPAFGGKGFYGHHVHEAVLEHGCKMTGCTVHLVDDQYDQGLIIAQKAVPVLPEDTADSLAARVQEAEREIFPQAIQLFAKQQIRIDARRVTILPKTL